MSLRLSFWLLCSLALTAGCVDPGGMSTPAQPEAAQPAAAPAAEPPAAAPAPVAQPVIPDVDPKLVDKQQALAENPALVETENRINALDPISAASQSYFAIGSKAYLLNFKHAVDLYKAEHDRNPTFSEFQSMLAQSNVQLKGLKPWQVYAYDATDGTFCILEDRAEKKRRYDEAGLEYKD